MSITASITARRPRATRMRSRHRYRRARAGSPPLLVALAAMALLSPAAARAETLFANIGSFTTYSPSGGSVVAGPGATGFQVVSEGVVFTPTLTGQLSLIELTLSRTVGLDPFRITLYTATPAGFPQSQLFTVVGPAPVASGSPIPLASFSSAAGPVLTAGTSYVLVASSDGNSVGHWDSALAGPGTIYRNEAGAERTIAAERAPGLRLSGSAVVVPEPGTLALVTLGVGTTGLLALRRRAGERE